ncbi:hypothetical protein [Afipia sp. DC4300-2b1]
MPKKRFSAEQIVVVLRQIEVLLSQGKSPPAPQTSIPATHLDRSAAMQ